MLEISEDNSVGNHLSIFCMLLTLKHGWFRDHLIIIMTSPVQSCVRNHLRVRDLIMSITMSEIT